MSEGKEESAGGQWSGEGKEADAGYGEYAEQGAYGEPGEYGEDPGGYYDEEGNWISGYHDEAGNWVSTAGAYEAVEDGVAPHEEVPQLTAATDTYVDAYVAPQSVALGALAPPGFSGFWDEARQEMYAYNESTGECAYSVGAPPAPRVRGGRSPKRREAIGRRRTVLPRST